MTAGPTELHAVLTGDVAQQTTLAQLERTVNAMYLQLGTIQRTLGVLVSEDATVAAQVAAIAGDLTTANTTLAQIQSAFAAVLADAGSAGLSPATLSALTAAQAQADAFASAITAAGSADAAAVPPAATPPPAG